MAETLLSPGVFTRENDISFVQPAPVEAGAVIIGPTVKGPVQIPTIVTSYGDYLNKFGATFTSGSTKQEYLTSVAVRSYFQQGGTTALVARVVSGSFSRATNTSLTLVNSGNAQPFVLETLGQGTLYNNATGSGDPGTENSDGSLVSGSVDNLRWEITNVNSSTGTFSLLVRRGDDNAKNKVVLETFSNLSLVEDDDNYIVRRIGDTIETISGDSTYVQVTGSFPNRSRYIRVASAKPIAQYFETDGTTVFNGGSVSGSLPIASSGSFYGATGGALKGGEKYYNSFTQTDTQGLLPSNYDNIITLLGNKDDYQFNVISAPGLVYDVSGHATRLDNIISLAETRGDCIAVIDTVSYAKNTTGQATPTVSSLNSSYAATYWPYVQIQSSTGKAVFVPASVVIPGVYAFTDNSSAPWFAPAGLVRGGIPGVVQTQKKLTKTERDTLYSANINPIATFPGTGIAVFGQKTLQKKASALDRVNVRRLLIEMKKFFTDQARNLVFEQNTIATRNRFLAAVNPYMESIVQRQGLYAFRVVMDDTNNTADVIDRNQLIGQIFIQPSKTAEFIVLDFTIEPTGATFVA